MSKFELVALLAFLFPLAFSPGPGNMIFAANGARFGVQATLGATAGYHLATFLVTVALGLGFISAISSAPEVFNVVKIAGSLYVLWLAWKLFRAGRLDSEVQAKPINFWDGAVLLVLNPKAYVIIALMFSQFISAADASTKVIVVSAIFTLNNFVAFTLWTIVGDGLAKMLSSEKHSRYLNSIFGGILTLVAVWMLLS